MADVKNIKLPRLPFNWRDQPGLLERYWDEAMSILEKNDRDLKAIPEIRDALQNLDQATAQAQAAAQAANDAAQQADASAVASAKESSIVNSFVKEPSDPVSADSTGQIFIAGHKRQYGDPSIDPTVTVNSGSLSTGAASGQTVRVFYDQPSRAGGAVAYQFTVDPQTGPVQGGNRHSVGVVVIPATGTQDGRGLRQPGYVEP